MNKKSLLALISVTPLILTACSATIDFREHPEEYVMAMKYHDNFNILQLTDIHWNYTSSTCASKVYLEKVLKEADAHIKATQGQNAKIDLIELTGDQFMLANAYHVETFMNFFEEQAVKYGFMYTAIWGNHDRHGIYNPNWLSDQFRKAEHCLYLEPEDNLYGRSNFVINLTVSGEKDSQTMWQIANLDSGASFSEMPLSPFRDYDYIRPEQTEWWVMEHDRAGLQVPTIAYYHIPQQDNLEAWNAIHNDGRALKSKWFKLEGFADNGEEEYASNFISTGRQHGLRAAFQGHAHNVDWTVDYDGVLLGLGVKTGTELYYAHIDPANPSMEAETEGLNSLGAVKPNEKFDLIGASLVTIRNALAFDLEHLYLNEREANDFVLWTGWEW